MTTTTPSLAGPLAGPLAVPLATSLATSLAEMLAQIDMAALSVRARTVAVAGIIDTVGVTLLGSAEPAARVLAHALAPAASASGTSLQFGTHRRIGTLDAALINGTASHAADYDDMARAMGGHPSVTLVPVILALGEELDASGRDVLEAYIVGFEAACRMGRMVNPHHYEHGWHPTSTLGVFGAAAAAARMLSLDVAQTATALCIAASMASGVKANFGTMTKPLHVGHCARNGLLAAKLAHGGFTSNPAAFEHPQGFLAAYDGLTHVHPERLADHWGELLEVEQPSVGLKQFPCCGSTHPAVRAMLDLASQGLRADDVASIEIMVNAQRLPHTNNPFPTSALGAKFSLQYVAARALVDGAVRLRHFEGESHLDPRVQTLLSKTSVAPYPATTDGRNNEFAADIVVVTHDGRRMAAHAPHALGRGGDDAMSTAEQLEKFTDCASRVLPPTQVKRAFDALQTIEQFHSIRDITSLLAAPPGN